MFIHTIKPTTIALIITLFFLLISFVGIMQNELNHDPFEQRDAWKKISSDMVEVQTMSAPGKKDSCLRINIDFKAGSGYGGIQKQTPLELPENFQFSFYLKGNLPINNLEFKLIDASGDNVWWYNQRNFEFPGDWKKVTVKKRNIEFAWGPTTDRTLKMIDKIEIMIASVNGGKGCIYLDEFSFEPLDPPDPNPPPPTLLSSSSRDQEHHIDKAKDENPYTYWQSKLDSEYQEIIIDCLKYREFGGLVIDWDSLDFAKTYEIYVSNNKTDWDLAYQVKQGAGGRRYLYLRDYDARFIKLSLIESSRQNGYAIKEIKIKDFEFARTPENFFKSIAQDHDRGLYPRYFLDEQSYWTITGPPDDDNEALINEDGQVEIDKRSFSIEPFIFADEHLYTWNDAQLSQHLEEDYLPVPSVRRIMNGLLLEIKIFAAKEGQGSALYLIYTILNRRQEPVRGNLYLTIRPFQVNPPWQFLNNPGGMAPIKSIKKQDHSIEINNQQLILPLNKPDAFGAVEFDAGSIIEFISKDTLPTATAIEDHFGYASAVLRYPFYLVAGENKRIVIVIPWRDHGNPDALLKSDIDKKLADVTAYWKRKVNTVQFHLPPEANRIINTIRSNLAYILINRDGVGIQPGSRSYERSWIRDGSLTSTALLKMAIQKEPKEFIEWYASYQYENGKVPCVVDRRGPDPVPENDSHGQLIYAIFQYYQFTRDKKFLDDHFESVRKAIDYMEDLSAQRRTEEYIKGNPIAQACYGLLPESISHEGYSAKPMHSYWDDFFALKGYKDAVEIAHILGKDEYYDIWSDYRDRFRKDLYNSISKAISLAGIDYIPGCVELGDFDATSTAIAVYPCNELKNLPQPQAQHTFDRYFEYFNRRLDPSFEWKDYTPYEVRLIGTFNYLGQRQRVHRLIDFFFGDQRPEAWNHWAEVVRKGYRTPGFIGDMPHTWVGSDFINALRSLFVYEDEMDQSLVIGSGLYDEWINDPEGMSVTNIPTYFGQLNYSVKSLQGGYKIVLSGSIEIPANGLKIRNFKNQLPKMVQVFGQKHFLFDQNFIRIKTLPAEVEVFY